MYDAPQVLGEICSPATSRFFEVSSVRYICCISINDEDKKPHIVVNHPKDSCFLNALLVFMSLVNIAEDWFQVDDWCLNHLFSPSVKKEVISGCVLALDNHCCKLLIILECWSLVDTAGHVKIWRRCSSGTWHLGKNEC